MRFLTVLALVWFASGTSLAVAQISAAEPLLISYSLPSLRDGSVDFGHLDRDGDLDLLVTGLVADETPLTRIYALQDSAYVANVGGAFVNLVFKVYRPVQSIVNDVWEGTAQWGDYDGDGDDDVLLFGKTYVERTVGERTVETVGEIYRNDSGILIQAGVQIPGLFNADAEWGDMDGDGDLDFAACGAGNIEAPFNPTTLVYENLGGGSFQRVARQIPGVMLCSVAWGDQNGDGQLELAISGQGDDALITQVYRPTSDVPESLNLDLPALVLGKVDWADYDGDGRDDLLASGGVLDPQLLLGTSILLRSEGDTMIPVDLGDTPGVVAGSMSWTDYDADGDPDIVISGAETALGFRTGRVIVNDGGSFVFEFVLAGLTQGDITVGDYNGDGDEDFLIIGLNDAGVPFTNFMMNRTFPELVPPGFSRR